MKLTKKWWMIYYLMLDSMEWEHITEEDIDNMMEGYEDPDKRWPHVRATLEYCIIKYDNNCANSHKQICDLISALIFLLPCDDCSSHFQVYVDNYPVPKTRKELLEWIIRAHDNVNFHNWKETLGSVEWLKNISNRITL